MKRFALIGLLFLVGCGGGGGDSAGGGNFTTVKLINSNSGKPLSDGEVEAFAVTLKFSPSLNSSGRCCTTSTVRGHVRIAKGFVNGGGVFSFNADESIMPKTEDLIIYDFSNAPPEMDTPEESEQSILTTLSLLGPLGYFVSGDGPGFFPKTRQVDREAFIGSAQITFPLNPI